MKKTLIILTIFLVAAFAVFAADTTTELVSLTSIIPEEQDFTLGLGYTTDGTNFTYLGEDGTATIAGFNAGVLNTVDFRVKQAVRINVTDVTAFDFGIAVSDWVQDGVTSPETNQTNEVSISAFAGVETTIDPTHNVSVGVSGQTSTVTYTKGVTIADTPIATFTVAWGNDGDLEAGNYTSNVTLSYTAVD